MQFSKLFDDDRAVSPVIGVILMVAITVILAAVIGTFVLGLSDQVQDTSPRADFAFDYKDPATGGDTLKITHETGDEISASQVNVVISGASESSDSTSDLNSAHDWDGTDLGGSDLTAGVSVTVSDNTVATSTTSDLDLTSATVRVTWDSESGESTATLEKWAGPDA